MDIATDLEFIARAAAGDRPTGIYHRLRQLT